MSTIASTTTSVFGREKSEIFQDHPIIDRNLRLTVIETRHSDKQVINELVYRWCRILTRVSKKSIDRLAGPSDTAVESLRKILIIDMVGAMNPIRLATVLKRDDRRMRTIGFTRGCRINSTYVTLNSYLGCQANISPNLKLIVVYQDEFYIMKTIQILGNCLQTTKCQILLVVPKLDRSERDHLNLISTSQILRCDFSVNRRDIGPAPVGTTNESYQRYINQVYFERHNLKVPAELREDGLFLERPELGINQQAKKQKIASDLSTSNTLPIKE